MDEDEIKSLHPLRTNRHDLFAEAMELVGARHGKFELVELVNALLAKIEIADRKAREECCEIIRERKVAIECATEFEQAYNHAIDDAVQAIIATIPEE